MPFTNTLFFGMKPMKDLLSHPSKLNRFRSSCAFIFELRSIPKCVENAQQLVQLFSVGIHLILFFFVFFLFLCRLFWFAIHGRKSDDIRLMRFTVKQIKPEHAVC